MRGLPLVNYPNVCTNAPKSGKAFCDEHLAFLSDQHPDIPTDIRGFLRHCGIDHSSTGSYTHWSVYLATVSLMHNSLLSSSSLNTVLQYLTRSYYTIWKNIHLISGNVCMKWASFSQCHAYALVFDWQPSVNVARPGTFYINTTYLQQSMRLVIQLLKSFWTKMFLKWMIWSHHLVMKKPLVLEIVQLKLKVGSNKLFLQFFQVFDQCS